MPFVIYGGYAKKSDDPCQDALFVEKPAEPEKLLALIDERWTPRLRAGRYKVGGAYRW